MKVIKKVRKNLLEKLDKDYESLKGWKPDHALSKSYVMGLLRGFQMAQGSVERFLDRISLHPECSKYEDK